MARPKLAAKTCKQITDLVLNYFDGTLSPPLTREFGRHLRMCPDCVRFLRTYKKTVAITRSVAVSDMPPNVRDNILRFLRKRLERTDASA